MGKHDKLDLSKVKKDEKQKLPRDKKDHDTAVEKKKKTPRDKAKDVAKESNTSPRESVSPRDKPVTPRHLTVRYLS